MRVAFFVFDPDPIRLAHAATDALDVRERGGESSLILEGAATGLVVGLAKEDSPFCRTLPAGPGRGPDRLSLPGMFPASFGLTWRPSIRV